MHRSSAILLCVAFIVLHTKCTFASGYDSIEEECKYEGSFNEKCFPGDTGYKECKWQSDIYKYLVENTTCTKPASKCKCYQDYEYKQKCECIDPTEPPQFPPVGIIHWNGTAEVDEDGGERTTYQYIGEVHKNSNGNFLLKKFNRHHMPFWNLPEKEKEFEIIIRNGTTFTKYKGEGNSTVCRKYEVSTEGDLTTIWKKHWNFFYKLDSEESVSDSKTKQVWKQFEQGEDYDQTWKWTVEYDSQEQYAIPRSYDFYSYDGFVGYTESVNYEYTFVPIGDDEETFHLEDYCTSFAPKKECDTKK